MKYSYNLLSELVDLKNFAPFALAEKINNTSFEVEAVEELTNFGIKDWAIAIETGKTNRVDVLGHWGLAAEISAITGRKLKKDLILDLPTTAPKTQTIHLKINPKLCRKYAAWKFNSVKVGPSPAWLKNLLAICGLKPINNIVDIVNYVMLLTGQPLHAFDAKKIKGGLIEVRAARKNEKLKTLDGERIELLKQDIVIADSDSAIALAGIKGGVTTGITQKTKEIIIEAANFPPRPVRRTSWRVGLRTDAAHRFEKNLPAEFIEAALNEVIDLLRKYANARPDALSIKDFTKEKAKTIVFKPLEAENLLGVKIPDKKIAQILNGQKLKYKKIKKAYRIQIPFYRTDLNLPEDIIEEIGRIHGYENIPEIKPQILTRPHKNQNLEIRHQIREILRGLGFNEVYNYSFYSQQEAKRYTLPINDHYLLANPLNQDQELLRVSLLPNLLKSACLNQRFFKEFSLFEFGNIYLKRQTSMFHDVSRLALCQADSESAKKAFMNLKGKIRAMFGALHIKVDFKPASVQGTSNRLNILDRNRTILGNLDAEVVDKVSYAISELDFKALVKAIPSSLQYQEFSRMPPKILDLAIAVDKSVRWADIERVVRKDDLVKDLKLFDAYCGPQIPSGQKSLAFTIVFQEKNRTLNASEVNLRLKNIIDNLTTKFKAKVR